MKTLPLLMLTACLAFAQGPLAPPTVLGPLVGPVPPVGVGGVPQAAMKTLHQVEPRTPLSGGVAAHIISAPGSYYLTGNVNQSGTSNAIRIDVEDVTLDLNGFSVIGSFSGANLAGISIFPSAKNVVVKSGVVRNWSGHAINASAPRFSVKGSACSTTASTEFPPDPTPGSWTVTRSATAAPGSGDLIAA